MIVVNLTAWSVMTAHPVQQTRCESVIEPLFAVLLLLTHSYSKTLIVASQNLVLTCTFSAHHQDLLSCTASRISSN